MILEFPKSFAYYCVAARRAGVPEMWVEDAAQDIMVAMWLEKNITATLIHRRAIDASRRYGRYSARGIVREIESLDEAHDVGMEEPRFQSFETRLDLVLGLRSLPTNLLQILERRFTHKPMKRWDWVHLRNARNELYAVMN